MKLAMILTVLAIGFLVMISGPSNEAPSASGHPLILSDEIRSVIEGNRLASSRGEDRDLQDFLYPYTQFASDETIAQISFSAEAQPRSVSLADAQNDVRFLFEVFKYGYCLYEVFGGDERFGNARDAILRALGEHATTGSVIRVADLKALILQNLGFIQDGHAKFAGVSLFERQRWFRNNRYAFLRDDIGYYLVKEPLSVFSLFASRGERTYLQSVEGAAPSDYLDLSLSADGQLVYILSHLAAQPTRKAQIHLVLATDQQVQTRTVTLVRQSGSVIQEALRDIRFNPATTYNLQFEGSIPIVVNRSTVPSPAAAVADLEQFIADAPRVGESEVAILDLRNHEGGQIEYPLAWIRAFTGQEPTYGRTWIELHTRTSMRLHQYFAQWYYTGNPEATALAQVYFDERIRYVDTDPLALDNVWQVVSQSELNPSILPNDTVLFVLMDAETGSAGEEFVEILQRFENVIFVGENTEGLTISGSPGWGTLPHSRLPFTLSIGMSIEDILAEREGMGMLPDLWVDSRLALERVLQYIQR